MKIIGSYKIHSTIEKIRGLNESIDPELEKRLRLDLKKYCTEAGKDYIEICKLAGLSTEGFENLDADSVELIEKYSSGPWSYDDKTGRVNIEGSFRADGWGADRDSSKLLDLMKRIKFGVIEGDFVITSVRDLDDITLEDSCPLEVTGNYSIKDSKITKSIMPPKIGKNIDMPRNKIDELVGFPNRVTGSVYLNGNKLGSLVGSPDYVGGDFNLSDQSHTGPFSLKGSPKEVKGGFFAEGISIETLQGCPEVVDGALNLRRNNLIDLKGNLKSVKGRIYVEQNNIATLEGLPLGISTYLIDCAKNLIPPAVLKSTYKDASNYKSWLAAYLKLSATERFKRMGKAERDPIRDRITPEIIAKSPVSISPIWKDTEIMNDPVVKRLIKKSGIDNDDVFKSAATTASDLSDLGF